MHKQELEPSLTSCMQNLNGIQSLELKQVKLRVQTCSAYLCLQNHFRYIQLQKVKVEVALPQPAGWNPSCNSTVLHLHWFKPSGPFCSSWPLDWLSHLNTAALTQGCMFFEGLVFRWVLEMISWDRGGGHKEKEKVCANDFKKINRHPLNSSCQQPLLKC